MITKVIQTCKMLAKYFSQFKERFEEEISKRETWRPKDDEKLIILYTKYPNNWARISDEMIHHDSDACRTRFISLEEGRKKGEWSAQETNKLIGLYAKYKNNFVMISKKMLGRSRKQIADRVAYLKKTKLISFDPRLESALVSAAIKHNFEWEAVSKECFPGFAPNVLKSKYEEIVSREVKDVSCNRDKVILLEGEVSMKGGDLSEENTNQSVVVSGHESSGSDFNMHANTIKRRNSTTQFQEFIQEEKAEGSEEDEGKEIMVFGELAEPMFT